MLKVLVKLIKTGNRIRQDYGRIGDLCNSMERIGQITPIQVDKNFNLISGGRRLMAAIEMKWEDIDATVLDVSNEISRVLVELEENIQREKLTWKEKVQGRVKYHTLASTTQEQTAQALGVSQSTIAQDIQLFEALKKDEHCFDGMTRVQAYKSLYEIYEEGEPKEKKEESPSTVGETLKDVIARLVKTHGYRKVMNTLLIYQTKKQYDDIELID